jgi:hypothetical protein
VFDVRYDFGLSDLDTRFAPSTPDPIDRSAETRAFAFTVGVLF